MGASTHIENGEWARASNASQIEPPAIWRWHPLAVAGFVLGIDFGVLMALRAYENGGFFLPWGNLTFLVGDSVLLPLYAAFTAIVVQSAVPSGNLYTRRSWHTAVALAGIALAFVLDAIAAAVGHHWIFAKFQPATTYHTMVFAILFYLLVSVLPLQRPNRSWASAVACLALACYLIVALIEIQPNAQQSVTTALALAHMVR